MIHHQIRVGASGRLVLKATQLDLFGAPKEIKEPRRKGEGAIKQGGKARLSVDKRGRAHWITDEQPKPKKRRARSDPFNKEPPGGWTEADKVPDEYRKKPQAPKESIQGGEPSWQRKQVEAALGDRVSEKFAERIFGVAVDLSHENGTPISDLTADGVNYFIREAKKQIDHDDVADEDKYLKQKLGGGKMAAAQSGRYDRTETDASGRQVKVYRDDRTPSERAAAYREDDAKREAARDQEAERKQEAKAEEAESYSGFTKGMTPAAAAKARMALKQPLRSGGVVQARSKLVEGLVEAGATVRGEGAKRRLQKPDGAFLDQAQISKTAMDYAEHLIARREKLAELQARHDEKVEDRRDRYENRAGAASAEANRRGEEAMRMAGIMQGEPVKVGHHSERRHRRDIERMDNNMRLASENAKRAEHYRDKAAGVGRGGESVEDPSAAGRLREKSNEWAERLEEAKEINAEFRKELRNQKKMRGIKPEDDKAYQEARKKDRMSVAVHPKHDQLRVCELAAIRKVIERGRPGGGDGTKPSSWSKWIAGGAERAIQSEQDMYRYSPVTSVYPAYALTSMREKAKRATAQAERVEQVTEERISGEAKTIGSGTHDGNDWEMVDDPESNRVRLSFNKRLSREDFLYLRSQGWRWSRNQGVFLHYRGHDWKMQDAIKRFGGGGGGGGEDSSGSS